MEEEPYPYMAPDRHLHQSLEELSSLCSSRNSAENAMYMVRTAFQQQREALGVCSLLRVVGWHGQPAVLPVGISQARPHTERGDLSSHNPPHTDTAQI